MPLWLRSLINALLLPGVVAGVAPWWIARGAWRFPLSLGAVGWTGLIALVPGVAVLALTIFDFARKGRGTLAPWDAPRHLVHQRLYAWVRNPMYLGVLACILGQGLLLASGGILAYAGVMAVVFHVRVVTFEEPALRQLFGQAFTQYATRVPRWVPRRPRLDG